MGIKWIEYHRKGDWSDYPIALGFFMLTAYLFIGIAIASDIFMNSIEKICGATRTLIESKEEDGVVITTRREILLWNETIANLTLMALGSSAPEILLSLIEISQGLGDQDPGELGPGTIVGSAAFNLMIIVAICVVCLKKDHTSRIKLYNVFIFTCFTGIFAYVWMVVVLQLSSPDEVQLWEALVTLMYMPLLVIIAYLLDRNCFIKKRHTIEEHHHHDHEEEERDLYFGDEDEDKLYDDDGNLRKEALQNLYYKLNEVAILTPDEIATILATKLIQGKQHRKSWYRAKASRTLLGYGHGMPKLDDKLKEVIDVVGETHSSVSTKARKVSSSAIAPITADTYNKMAVVEFQAAAICVKEGIGSFPVGLHRKGKEDVGFQVKVESFDGTAIAGTQYESVSQVVKFDPYVREASLNVKIVDNSEWNPDSNFYLKLSLLPESQGKAVIGQMKVLQINIEDDDQPGKLTFVKLGHLFKGTAKAGYVDVERTDGSDGKVTVKWKVIPGPKCTVIAGDLSGIVEFESGETRKTLEVFLDSGESDISGHDQVFEIDLYEPTGGAKLGRLTKTKCAVSNDDSFKLQITNVINTAIAQCQEVEEDASYKDQILQAFVPNDGDYKNASTLQWISHIVVFPFKVTTAILIPPASLCKGWLCFIMALAYIGLLTKIVGESAGCLGDCLGFDPVVTAITFVALGTSLPDTFASVIAARNDKYADNAIGNVTGSNSVNVFLGLGLPWTIGAIFYTAKGTRFCVLAGKLTFNVVVFAACAFLTVVILIFRRFTPICGKAELGGPTVTKWITSVLMIMLWLSYIILSYLEVSHFPEIAEPFDYGGATECERIVKKDKHQKITNATQNLTAG